MNSAKWNYKTHIRHAARITPRFVRNKFRFFFLFDSFVTFREYLATQSLAFKVWVSECEPLNFKEPELQGFSSGFSFWLEIFSSVGHFPKKRAHVQQGSHRRNEFEILFVPESFAIFTNTLPSLPTAWFEWNSSNEMHPMKLMAHCVCIE